jgi:hypothetical protein
MTKVEMRRVGLRLFREDGRWGLCRFSALFSTREGRRWDEPLLKDEAETVSSSWFHAKEA